MRSGLSEKQGVEEGLFSAKAFCCCVELRANVAVLLDEIAGLRLRDAVFLCEVGYLVGLAGGNAGTVCSASFGLVVSHGASLDGAIREHRVQTYAHHDEWQSS